MPVSAIADSARSDAEVSCMWRHSLLPAIAARFARLPSYGGRMACVQPFALLAAALMVLLACPIVAAGRPARGAGGDRAPPCRAAHRRTVGRHAGGAEPGRRLWPRFRDDLF